MSTISTANPLKHPAIASDEALRIARLEAEKAYGDLSGFNVTLALEPDGWHIDYELKDPNWNGGGPHFVIDPSDGRIVWKRYDQ
ncbi:MAG TPA: hypothetical protein DDY78_16095 [Planctomycetales bacterium]|jgi:hypothetical protein|nr:hypothetical protein [Planctomycetales bacterium]